MATMEIAYPVKDSIHLGPDTQNLKKRGIKFKKSMSKDGVWILVRFHLSKQRLKKLSPLEYLGKFICLQDPFDAQVVRD